MDFEQAIQARHSVRKFTAQPVATKDLKAILADAQLAPSWVNSQPYHVHVVTGKTLERVRAKQATLDQAGTKGTPDVPLMSRQKWSAQAQANMAAWSQGLGAAGPEMAGNAAQLYHAPVVLYLTLPTDYSEWSLYDLGAFGNSLVLSASSRGIASMTAYQFIKYPAMLRQEVGIPTEEKIIIGIGLGYRDDTALVNTIKSTRMALDEITTWHD